jgi:hypothetical protein
MGLVLTLIVVALLLGVIGLVVRALKWLLYIAVAVFVVGLVRGWLAQRQKA